jgi:hypothetical protein
MFAMPSIARRQLVVAVVVPVCAFGVLPTCALAAPRTRLSAPVEIHVGRSPWRVVAADFNGDGRPDVATADHGSGAVSVAFGRGNGSFRKHVARYRTASQTADLAAGDLNGDGRPDLAAASFDRHGSLTVLLNAGAGRFQRDGTYPTGARAPAVAIADVNRDGLPDILTANLGPHDLTVLLNQGAGHFAPPRRVAGGTGATDIDVGDLNGDGDPDAVLATALHGNVVSILLGNGDGSFAARQSYKAGRDPDGVTLADLNRDGRLDVAVTNAEGQSVSVFLGRGDGTLAPPARYSVEGMPDAVVAADFNLDGIPDLATSAVDFSPAVATGHGDGTFGPIAESDWLFEQGAATADFNLDGRADLAFADSAGLPEADVYLNWTGLSAAPCVVLDLSGDTEREAKGTIHDGGCRVGRIRYRFSRHVREGRVIAQRPRTGSVLPSHSRVGVTISRGRGR